MTGFSLTGSQNRQLSFLLWPSSFQEKFCFQHGDRWLIFIDPVTSETATIESESEEQYVRSCTSKK